MANLKLTLDTRDSFDHSKRGKAPVEVSLGEALDWLADRFQIKDDVDALMVKLISCAYGRENALADHESKVRSVKAARKAGKRAPKSISFKRYTPIDADKALDAPDTEREVAAWTRKAPKREVPAAKPAKAK